MSFNQTNSSTWQSLRRIMRLAIPLVFTNIFIPLQGIINSAIAGHLKNATVLAGLGIGVMIFNLLFWSFGFLKLSTTGLVAQARGAHDLKSMRRLTAQALLLAFILGSLIILIHVPLERLIFYYVEAKLDVLKQVHIYYVQYILYYL